MSQSDWRAQAQDAVEKMGTDAGYFSYGAIVWDALPDGHREQLKQLLYQGPVYDGSVISKSARDDLLKLGLAVRCCFMGEDGFTAASYAAYSVAKQGKSDRLQIKQGTPS
ncbi:hypothetical protein [Acetobacter syzygii]|uniref:Uncharacterized protein n=1 Tax=Acetobacter syzygii TaxID=146476 RepID=A0A270B7J2_9PROT|nr:hypothetical protein [Acetobacter syzygii]PAL21014.1 hypothetical protein B9K05_11685 [Acetobacter syzygii]PAL23345.1 hypothetical protein B9K04_11650 [Acetobacter syzygii]